MRPLPRYWRDAGFVLALLAVFLSPMNALRLRSIYLTASDGAAVLSLMFLLRNNALPRRPFGEASSLWFWGFLLLAAGLTVGSIANGAPLDLAVVLAQYSFSLILLPLILAGRPLSESLILLKVLLFSIVVVMLFGIYQVHLVDNPPSNFVSPSGRLRSLVERENECATLGAMGVVLALGLWQSRQISLIWLVASLPPLAYGIMLTGSNTGLGVTALGVAGMVALTGSVRLIGISAIMLAALIAVAIAWPDLVPVVFRNRVLTGLQSHDLGSAGTFTDRLLLIKEGFARAGDHLLIGMGAEQFRTISSHGAPVHNTYLLLLNEGGILSLLGLVALMLTGMPAALNGFGDTDTRPLRAITLTVLMIYALMLNTFPHFYARFWNVPLILAFALSAALAEQRARRSIPASQGSAYA